MVRVSRYKHRCDKEGCGNYTLMHCGVRQVWFNYKGESLCVSCFNDLPQDDRDDVERLDDYLMAVSMDSIKNTLEGKDTTFKLSVEEKALLMKFDAFHTSEATGKTKVKFMRGASRW